MPLLKKGHKDKDDIFKSKTDLKKIFDPFFISFVSDYKIRFVLRFYPIYLAFLFVHLHAFAQKSTFVDKDIEKYFPKFEYKLPDQNLIVATIPVGNTSKVNSMIDSIFDSNMKIKYMQGYKILVYSGNDKDEAEKVKKRLYQMSLDPELIYKQPTYRIKLGDFSNRLDAKRFMMKTVIREYPKAIIIDDNVLIKRSRDDNSR